MTALLTAIALWLSANFGLPASDDHPRVEFVPAAKLATLRYRGLAAGWQPQSDAATGQAAEIVSVYEDETSTIYLPDGWTGRTPAELSILVHEMVHHLQNVGRLKFACPQEREKMAYEAQEQWLKLFGFDLSRAFELDPF